MEHEERTSVTCSEILIDQIQRHRYYLEKQEAGKFKIMYREVYEEEEEEQINDLQLQTNKQINTDLY